MRLSSRDEFTAIAHLRPKSEGSNSIGRSPFDDLGASASCVVATQKSRICTNFCFSTRRKRAEKELIQLLKTKMSNGTYLKCASFVRIVARTKSKRLERRHNLILYHIRKKLSTANVEQQRVIYSGVSRYFKLVSRAGSISKYSASNNLSSRPSRNAMDFLTAFRLPRRIYINWPEFRSESVAHGPET